MRYLLHDSGGAGELRNQQVLGDASPIEFDEDGRAGPVGDELAEKVAAMDAHVSLGKRVRGDAADETDDANGEADEDFDAEAFVDRTPMEDVVADIESGDYDDHLEAIKDAADRQGVEKAVDKRPAGE